MPLEKVTVLIAIYGAITATIALGWNISVSRRDLARLHLRIRIDYQALERDKLVPSAKGRDGASPVIRMMLSNSGKRPITVVFVATKAKKQVVADSLSKGVLVITLNDSQPTVIDLHPILGMQPESITHLIAEDSTGKTWKSKVRYWK
jgi:hypothetical protein